MSAINPMHAPAPAAANAGQATGAMSAAPAARPCVDGLRLLLALIILGAGAGTLAGAR
jgi:hypothetical protein